MPLTKGTGNVLLTDDVIAREALRLLKNNLIAARYVNRNLENKFGASYKIGDSISVKKPFRTKTASGRNLVVQPMVDQTVSMKVDQQEHFALKFTLNDRTLSINEFSERYLKSGMVQLAHKVDLSILRKAYQTTFFATGTPGLGLNYETMIDARAAMSMVGHPDDGETKFLLNPLDAASHRKKLININNDSLVKSAIEKAYIGNIAGMDGFETAQMPVHTTGIATGSPTVNGAGQTGASLVTTAWTASTSGILKRGDIITIAGVFAINPQTYESTGQLQQFVVTADVNSAGAGAATIPISPAINPGTLTTVDGDGATVSLAAYQNVTNAPAAGAAITVLGAGNTAYRQNLILHRDALTLAVVDIALPQSAVVAERKSDPETGLSLAMTAAYNISDYTETYRIDILWGVENLYPELGRRVFGSA